jgi:hypothetical protein
MASCASEQAVTSAAGATPCMTIAASACCVPRPPGVTASADESEFAAGDQQDRLQWDRDADCMHERRVDSEAQDIGHGLDRCDRAQVRSGSPRIASPAAVCLEKPRTWRQ